jgi:type VI secretion system protein ImpI
MQLRLTIENMDRLPDGGPVRVQVENRGLDIGRDQHLDWTLPDPSRHVSSKHCEIRFRDGEYWLHDVSTNGTFVNGAQFRLDAPYRLRNGDRLSIGQYIVAVEVEGQQAAGAPPSEAIGAANAADLWDAAGEAAAPDDRRGYMPTNPRPAAPDFLDFASGLAPAGSPLPMPPLPMPPPAMPALAMPPLVMPPTAMPPPVAAPFAAPDEWLRGPVAPPPVEPAPAIAPSPRRPAPPLSAPAAPPVDAWPSESGADGVSAPAPAAPPPVAGAGAAHPDLLAIVARAAGVSERALAGRDPAAVADDIGVMLRLVAQNLAQMLASRSETKGLMRSSSRTMIRALENNPLKFTATPEEALAIMLGPPTRNYLDARTTLERSFADLQAHQMQTYGAVQGALEALFEDLAPDKIDASVEADRGLGALVGSRKAKLWDAYVERWRARTKRSDGRLFDAFMLLFAESYDRLQRKEP